MNASFSSSLKYTIVRLGVENLMGVLSEQGLLVMGSTESFSISTKIHGERVLLQKSGDF